MIPFTTLPEQRLRLFEIAVQMKAAGLPASFIDGAVSHASEYEGTADLMELWLSETDHTARDEIVADIQEALDDHLELPRKPVEKPYVRYDNLEVIARDVIGFKSDLRRVVDQWGSLAKLSHATGIPQSSLSRFFKSASMPRRTTLYRIYNAIGLGENEILAKWAA